MSEIEEVEPRLPSPPIEEDTIYVALGKDVKKFVTVLMWALQNSGGRKICILHILQLAQKIPMDAMGTKVPITLLDEHKVRAYHENQRQEMQEILEKYVQICRREGAETLHREMDYIEKGIVQLLSQLRIKWLVMGTGSCKSYSRGKETTLQKIFSFRNSTRKTTYVRLKAPSFCRISFIWKGNLIHTRYDFTVVFFRCDFNVLFT
ncbi:U-box domain-containing protein 33-like isoform X2 [Olea europaea var. sylvestris]|uniref:U-box domain-containing protein 33-like isoform X2 n=1 Tax=Olea europaea var. sylvestris TaxID=158386 RepID=UPI000C1CFBAE|nr:U-box domain-containing protein 33-like isoform X2 [Olea europaea var. sylvestris]